MDCKEVVFGECFKRNRLSEIRGSRIFQVAF